MKTKKILAFILSLCMVFGMTAIAASAANEVPQIGIILFSNDSSTTDSSNDALAVYVDGELEYVIEETFNENVTSPADFFKYIPYDEGKSYVFKYIPSQNSNECTVIIVLAGENGFESGDSDVLFIKEDMSEYSTMETVLELNTADYSALDEAMKRVPAYFENYSAQSVANLVTAFKGIKRMLPKSKQADVDAMTAAVNAALDGLAELETPVPNGVINLGGTEEGVGKVIQILDGKYSQAEVDLPINLEVGNDSIAWCQYEYTGKYTVINSALNLVTDGAQIAIGDNRTEVTCDIDFVNVEMLASMYSVAIAKEATASVGFIGNNTFSANVFNEYEIISPAPFSVMNGGKLKIKKESTGTLLAFGGYGGAAIGGCLPVSETDESAAEIQIDGGKIFAIGRGGAAAIGSSYNLDLGKITINGGDIYAVSFGGGAAIGSGLNGKGGTIKINGGNITALNTDKSMCGAAIGTSSSVQALDLIEINGGNIVAGSKFGKYVIGDADYTDGTRVVVNGGNIFPSETNSSAAILLVTAKEGGYIEINGGTFAAEDVYKTSPETVRNSAGTALVKKTVTVDKELVGESVKITLSDGSGLVVTPNCESFAIYAPESVTVSSAVLESADTPDDPADEPDDPADEPDGGFSLLDFFRSIINWFISIFRAIINFFAGLFA